MANPNTAVFPAALVTDLVLPVLKNNAFSALTAGIDDTVTTIPVVSAAAFTYPCLISFENEIVLAAGPASGNDITNCTRGFGGTTPAAHLEDVVGYGYIFSYLLNQLSVEVKAIQTALGTTLSGVVKTGATAGGDLSGTYPNPDVDAVGGASAASIASTVTLVAAATDADDADAIVKRDSNGDFSANEITADLVGNATTATSAPPSGAANGDLSGTYPNPTLDVIIIGGSAGSATQTPVITVDTKGRITALAATTITGVAPGGAAGGDLSGTYPNPDVDTVGGASAAAVATAVGVVADATAVNTPGLLVVRDGNGDFAANEITADLVGNATTATGAAPTGSAGGDLAGTYPNPTLNVAHFVSNTGAPTQAAGTGVGTGPTMGISGSDAGVKLNITTGTTCTAGGNITVVTFDSAYDVPPRAIVISPGNLAAAGLAVGARPYISSVSTGSFTMTAGAAALTDATAYVWYVVVLG